MLNTATRRRCLGSTSAGTSEATSHHASDTATGSIAGGNSTIPAEAVDNIPGDSATTDNDSKSATTAEKGVSEPDAYATSQSRKGRKAKITGKPQVYDDDPVGAVVVPVFKFAVGFLKNCLWKNQVSRTSYQSRANVKCYDYACWLR